MRVYHSTPSEKALQILKNGFRDTDCEELELLGIWFTDKPIDVDEGYGKDTVLALELPEEVFVRYERVDEWRSGYRWSVIPALEANAFGPAKVHDHKYAMFSRRDLLENADCWDAKAAEIRKAIRFFDEIGWGNITTNIDETRG